MVTGKPSTTTRELVRAAWTEILDEPEIDDQDDFFALGGHSLLLVALATRLRTPDGRAVPAHQLLDDPTVVGMANVLDGFGPSGTTELGVAPTASGPRTVPTTAWQAHALSCRGERGDGTGSARGVPAAVPAAWVFTIEHSGAVDVGRLESALRSLIDRHTALRTFFPSGATLTARCAAPADIAVPLRVCHTSDVGDADLLRDLSHPFDPASPPLLRAAVLRRDDGWLLGVAASDLVFDALSVPAMLRGMARPGADGAASDSMALAKRERTWINSPEGRRAVQRGAERWRSGAPRFPEPNAGVHVVRREHLLSPAAVRRNLELCRAVRVSPATTLVAATLLALRDATRHAEPAVLVQASRRDDPDLQHAIGPYENLAVLHLRLEPGCGLADVAARVRDADVDAEAPTESVRERAGVLAPPVIRFLGAPRESGFEWRETGRARVPDGMQVSWIAGPSGGAVLRLDCPGEWTRVAGEVMDALTDRIDSTAVAAR